MSHFVRSTFGLDLDKVNNNNNIRQFNSCSVSFYILTGTFTCFQ